MDFYEVGMRNGLDLCGGLLKQSQAIQQFRVTEYQSANVEWQISYSLTLTPMMTALSGDTLTASLSHTQISTGHVFYSE